MILGDSSIMQRKWPAGSDTFAITRGRERGWARSAWRHRLGARGDR